MEFLFRARGIYTAVAPSGSLRVSSARVRGVVSGFGWLEASEQVPVWLAAQSGKCVLRRKGLCQDVFFSTLDAMRAGEYPVPVLLVAFSQYNQVVAGPLPQVLRIPDE